MKKINLLLSASLAGALFVAAACSAVPSGLLSVLATQGPSSASAANSIAGKPLPDSPVEPPGPRPVPQTSPTAPVLAEVEQTSQPSPALPALTANLPHSSKQTSSLLFLSGGNLMRWDYVTGFSSPLVEGVTDFSISASGKQVAVARPRKISANGVELFDLAIFDFDSLQVSNLVEQTSRLSAFAVSPDGRWVTYMVTDKQPEVFAVPAYALALDAPSHASAPTAVQGTQPAAQSSQAADQPFQLGTCSPQNDSHCQELLWSPDSQSVAWMDAQGIWVSSLRAGAASLISPGQVEIADPKGNKSQIEVDYNFLSWSPVGRFLLTRIVTSSDVSWQAVLDSRSGRLVEVPDTFGQMEPIVNLVWLKDGSLMVAHASNPMHNSLPFIKVWQVFATSNNLLASKQFNFHSDELPQSISLSKTIPTICLSWPGQLEAQKIAFATTLTTASANPVLFTLDLQAGRFQKLLEIPYDPVQVLWSPDGGGALVIGSRSEVLFVPFGAASNSGGENAGGKNPIHNESPIFSPDARDFQWLPLAPRA